MKLVRNLIAAAVNVLNFVAGNVGETVRFGADLPMTDGQAGVARLAQAIDGNEVAVLLVHGANPVYTLPKASAFADRFRKVGYKVAIGLYLDETASECDLMLPERHALERWDDLRPRAGGDGANPDGTGATL